MQSISINKIKKVLFEKKLNLCIFSHKESIFNSFSAQNVFQFQQ